LSGLFLGRDLSDPSVKKIGHDLFPRLFPRRDLFFQP
jgi:hypothetical protein